MKTGYFSPPNFAHSDKVLDEPFFHPLLRKIQSAHVSSPYFWANHNWSFPKSISRKSIFPNTWLNIEIRHNKSGIFAYKKKQELYLDE
jgi:hypothetical protein